MHTPIFPLLMDAFKLRFLEYLSIFESGNTLYIIYMYIFKKTQIFIYII